jgi:hypothetical protein
MDDRPMTRKTHLASEVYRPPGGVILRWRVWEVGPGNGLPSTLEANGLALTYGGARRAVARAMRRFYAPGKHAVESSRKVATLRFANSRTAQARIGTERRSEAL